MLRSAGLAIAALLGLNCAAAQQAVPAAQEPHHRTVHEDARVRILEVQLDARGSTLEHRHETDYVWVTLGDPRIHFSRGALSHVNRNDSDRVSREILVELLQRQTTPRNVCGEVLQGEYLHCREPGAAWLGANLQIQFETDQTQIGVLQIAPDATLAIPPADVPPVLIALEGTDVESVSRVNGAPVSSSSRNKLKGGDVVRSSADRISEIRNTGKTAARFLVVEFAGRGE